MNKHKAFAIPKHWGCRWLSLSFKVDDKGCLHCMAYLFVSGSKGWSDTPPQLWNIFENQLDLPQTRSDLPVKWSAWCIFDQVSEDVETHPNRNPHTKFVVQRFPTLSEYANSIKAIWFMVNHQSSITIWQLQDSKTMGHLQDTSFSCPPLHCW